MVCDKTYQHPTGETTRTHEDATIPARYHERPASGRADKEYTVKIKEGYNLSNALAMSTEEVVKLISGMTVHGTNTKGKKYRMYFAENGSLTAGNKSTGKWEVKDGSVCNTWDECGFAGCDAVFKNKGKIIYKTPSVKTNVGSKS